MGFRSGVPVMGFRHGLRASGFRTAGFGPEWARLTNPGSWSIDETLARKGSALHPQHFRIGMVESISSGLV